MRSNTALPVDPSMEDAKPEVSTMEHDAGQGYDEQNAGKISIRTVLCCLSALMTIFTAVFGISATGAYAGVISAELGNAGVAAWLANAAQINQCALGPPVALWSDVVGRKVFLVFALAAGAVGAIVTATAKTAGVGIAGAVITGLFFSAQGITVAIPSETLPRSQRTMMQAIFNVFSSAGGSLGLVAGALFIKADITNWRWIYRTMAILYGLTCIAVFFAYRPLERRPDTSKITKRKGIWVADIGGAFLLGSGCVCFFMGLVWAENPYPWKSAHVLAPLVTGVALFISFGIYEWKFIKDGILHHALFQRSRNYALCLGMVFIEGIMFFSFNSFWARSINLIFLLSPYEGGLRFVGFFAVSVLVTPAVGWFSRRYKNVTWLLYFGWILFIVSAIGMATATVGSLSATVAYNILGGIGFSAPLSLIAATAQLSAPSELMATASNNLLVGRALGGVFSVSIYNAIWKSELSQKLGPAIRNALAAYDFPEAKLEKLIAVAANEKAAALKAIPGVTPEIVQATLRATQVAYAESFRWIWVLAAPFGLVAIILTYFLEDVKSMMTHHIDAPAEVKTQPDERNVDDSTAMSARV